MKMYQPFLNYESGSIDKRKFNKIHFWKLSLFPDLGSSREKKYTSVAQLLGVCHNKEPLRTGELKAD